ncbi:Na/Pi cotransporter family protein [Exiguobacterium sp.]|uniref:Na/Pi cotransporter family protein n=1 Tax=Exiguobacterium sp. TaxID=44751 RepID=UPI00289D3DDE|nr:Na/Pi cotransporter family protein [Exiguobacterium sp.]
MNYDLQEMIFTFIGGLGIFLFGIKYMGDGLQKTAGDRLRYILDKYTTNPLLGILAGIVVTILIQSSSGTTVIVVGLVSAGLMNLRQAIGVVMGANIGTTITAFIIGFNVKEAALPAIAIGAFLIFFFNKERVQYIGQIFFGFGALFYGLTLMGDGMAPLESSAWFRELTVSMSDNPLLGVFVGTIFTVLVQSSSATIGILQELYAGGMIDIKAALPVLFGDNIGTTITAVLAALGASIAAKRTAAAHVIFNIIGTILFLIALPVFSSFIAWITGALGLEPKMQIAFAHGTFNVVNTLIQCWFIAQIAWLVQKIVPGTDTTIDSKPRHLDQNILNQSSALALNQAKLEVLRMGEFSKDALAKAHRYTQSHDKKDVSESEQIEYAINHLNTEVTSYLVKVAAHDLSERESNDHSLLMHAVNDFERIGDHVENIVELIDFQIVNRIQFTTSAKRELDEMYVLTQEIVACAIRAVEENDVTRARKVLELEGKLDALERSFRKHHVLRVNAGECTGQAGMIFVDLLSNLERIGDHAVNITDLVLEQRTALMN